MRHLIISDVIANRSIWVGALCISAAAAAALCIAAALVETAFGTSIFLAAALAVLASAVVVLTVTSTTVVLSSVAQLTVGLQRRSYALWQLVGVPARTITWVIRAQMLVVSVLGAVVGTAVAAPFTPAFLRFGLSESSGLQHLDVRFSILGAVVVVTVVGVVMTFAALPATRRAAQVRPIEVLRDPQQGTMPMTWLRWVLTAVAVALASLMTWSLGAGGSISGGSQILLIGPVFTAAAAASGPVLFPVLLRLWTAALPARLSASWFLARNAASYEVARSSATISALLVTVALPGGLYAGFDTFGNATTSATGQTAGSLAPSSFLLLVGGPLLVSVAGAAATVLMATRTREQEAALVQAAGGTRSVVVLRAAWEGLILVVTAVLAAALVLVCTAAGSALSLSRAVPTTPGFGIGPAALAALACTVVLVTASVVPVLGAVRRSIRTVLADE